MGKAANDRTWHTNAAREPAMGHALKPFRHAIGVDIAVDSIAAARTLAGMSPIELRDCARPDQMAQSLRHAFSYEVIYLSIYRPISTRIRRLSVR
jgi:hypothetical protein